VERGIWYKDEGFLIWIIPSMYLSHEAIIWVELLVLLYLLSSSFNLFLVLLLLLSLYYLFLALSPVYYFTDLLLLHIVHNLSHA